MVSNIPSSAFPCSVIVKNNFPGQGANADCVSSSARTIVTSVGLFVMLMEKKKCTFFSRSIDPAAASVQRPQAMSDERESFGIMLSGTGS